MRFENKTLAVLVVILFMSLMGNMFALGYALGGGHGPSARCASKHDQYDQSLRERLSRKDKNVIRRGMSENKDVLRQKQNAWKETRKAAATLLDQETYDETQYNQLKKQERAAFLEMQKEMERIWSDIAPQLSEKGRKQMSKVMAQGVNLKMLRKAISPSRETMGDHKTHKPPQWEQRKEREHGRIGE